MITPSPLEGRNSYLRANSLAELLLWDDVDFIRCAYVTILGRQPDSTGEAHFTNRIRMGDSKYSVLWQLRRSSEGPRHDPGIAGLDRALKREARRRHRLFGWLSRIFVRGDGVSAEDRRARQMRNMLVLLMDQQWRRQSQQTVGTDLAPGLDKIAGQLAQITDQIAAIKASIAHQPGGGSELHSPVERFDPSVHVTDDLDLSSRARSIVWALQSARH